MADSVTNMKLFRYSDSTSFEPSLVSTTMEQAPLLNCHNCKTSKLRDQFNVPKKDDKHGRKGESTSKWSSYTIRNQQGRQNLKLKRDEERPNPSEDPPEPGPANSIEQFTALLHEQACKAKAISIIGRVSPFKE